MKQRITVFLFGLSLSVSVCATAEPDPLLLVEQQMELVASSQKQMDILGCILEPSIKVEVSSPVAGVIETVPVKRGDLVKKGKVLFTLRAGVEAAALNLAKVKEDFAKRKKNRNEELFQDDMLSPYERDEIETELQIARMERRLRQEELALRTVYSPVDGVITDNHFSAGEYVNTDAIVSMAALDPLHVDVLLPANYFGQVAKDDLFMVLPDQPVGGRHQAEVRLVDPLVDPASGTFRVQLALPNPDYALPAGIRCQLEPVAGGQ